MDLNGLYGKVLVLMCVYGVFVVSEDLQETL